MKAPKLLKMVNRYLSADKDKQYKNVECFKDVLKKLKKKERILKKKLENEKDQAICKQLKKELAIIYAQRKKGINAVKQFKKES